MTNMVSTLSAADIAAALAAFAGMASALIAAVALREIRKQIAASDRATEATLFVTINNEWKAVYPIYRKVLAEDVPMSEFEKYDTLDKFMISDTWQLIRPIFAFYEFLGSCVEAGLIRKDLLFKLVNVDVKLWEKYEPLISKMRTLGRYPDLYKRWQSLSALRKVSTV